MPMLHSMVLAASHLSLARDLLEHYAYIALFLPLLIEFLIFFIPGAPFLLMPADYTPTARLPLRPQPAGPAPPVDRHRPDSPGRRRRHWRGGLDAPRAHGLTESLRL